MNYGQPSGFRIYSYMYAYIESHGLYLYIYIYIYIYIHIEKERERTRRAVCQPSPRGAGVRDYLPPPRTEPSSALRVSLLSLRRSLQSLRLSVPTSYRPARSSVRSSAALAPFAAISSLLASLSPSLPPSLSLSLSLSFSRHPRQPRSELDRTQLATLYPIVRSTQTSSLPRRQRVQSPALPSHSRDCNISSTPRLNTHTSFAFHKYIFSTMYMYKSHVYTFPWTIVIGYSTRDS